MTASHQSILEIDEVFRRLSFGENARLESVDSLFVSLGLVIAYLNHKLSGDLIGDIYQPEQLYGATWSKSKYLRTNEFVKVLQRMFGQPVKAHELWGKRFATKFNQAWPVHYFSADTFMQCSYTSMDKDKVWQQAVTQCSENRPMMVVLGKLNLHSYRMGEVTLKNYVVVVGGYRITSAGRRELLIHPGQYGEVFIKGSRAQMIYIPCALAICGYTFKTMSHPKPLY